MAAVLMAPIWAASLPSAAVLNAADLGGVQGRHGGGVEAGDIGRGERRDLIGRERLGLARGQRATWARWRVPPRRRW